MSTPTLARPKRPRVDPAYIAGLRAGTDRDGLERNWHEVAAIAGISANYARRLGTGSLSTKAPVWVDPRNFHPELVMSDEEVAAWNRDPHCLCGCGSPCRQELCNSGKVPIGGYRLFRGAHEKRMPWYHGMTRINENEEICRQRGLTQRAANVHTAVIVGLLSEWREEHPDVAYVEIAEKARLSHGHVRDIATGRHERIEKLTAAKLLVALNEPLRPELFAEYKVWAKAEGVPYRHIVVSQ